MNPSVKLGPIVFASIIVLCAGQPAAAQVDWAFEDLAVPNGPPGSWNSANQQLGEVVFDGTTYHLYAAGGQANLSWESSWAVGHWTSSNLNGPWTPDPRGNPVLAPEPGQWDGFTIYSLAVRYDGSGFQMWYGAAAAGLPAPVYVGYASSPDGSVWTKHPGNPLAGLVPGASGNWDDSGVAPGTVLFDGAVYGMWTTAIKYDGSYGDWSIGYASSADGLTWEKHPDPVLVATKPWEGENVYFPTVVPLGSGFAMWYSCLVPGYASISYAVSPDGLHWGKHPDNPILTPNPGCNAVDSFAVLFDGDMIHGWTNHCYDVYHVTSPRELVYFDTFETGDTTIWGNTAP